MITTYTVGEVYNGPDFQGTIHILPRRDGSSTILTRDDVLTMFQTVFPALDYESFILSQQIRIRVELDSRFTALGPDCFRQTIVTEVIFQKDTQMADLGTRAFDSCSFLEFVDLSNTNVTEIPTDTFQGVGSYLPADVYFNVKLPRMTLTRVEDRSFAYSKLQWIHVPEGVLSLGLSAFSRCGFLESVSLPSTLVSPPSLSPTFSSEESNVFQGCDQIRTVICSSGMVTVFDTFLDNLFVYNTTDDPVGYVRKQNATDALILISDQQPPGTKVLFPFIERVSNNRRFNSHRIKYETSLQHVIEYFVPNLKLFQMASFPLESEDRNGSTSGLVVTVFSPNDNQKDILHPNNDPGKNETFVNGIKWYGLFFPLTLTEDQLLQSMLRKKEYDDALAAANKEKEPPEEEEEDFSIGTDLIFGAMILITIGIILSIVIPVVRGHLRQGKDEGPPVSSNDIIMML
jgi:hypothetical protein